MSAWSACQYRSRSLSVQLNAADALWYCRRHRDVRRLEADASSCRVSPGSFIRRPLCLTQSCHSVTMDSFWSPSAPSSHQSRVADVLFSCCARSKSQASQHSSTSSPGKFSRSASPNTVSVINIASVVSPEPPLNMSL